MYTIMFSAVDASQTRSRYSGESSGLFLEFNIIFTESCSSVLSTIFSSGRDGMPQISTIKPNNTCADDFGGTSAVNPFAAGVIGTFFRMCSM